MLVSLVFCRRIGLFFLILGTFLMETAVWAVSVNSLYQAEVPVASQSVSEKQAMQQRAFLQVLNKVSGADNLLDYPAIQAAMQQLDQFVQEVSYAVSTLPATPYRLHVRFDEARTNRVLQNAGIPVWGKNRPLFLAWLVYGKANQPWVIVDNGMESEVKINLMQAAKSHGLPVILPIMDMTDLSQVEVKDITQSIVPTLQNASKRYTSDGLLVAQLIQSGEQFLVTATIYLQGEEWHWRLSANSIEEAANRLFEQVNSTLVKRFATPLSTIVQSSVTLKITNVATQDDFAQLIAYLNRLDSVAEVDPWRIMGKTVILKLRLHTNKERLIQALLLEHHLKPSVSTSVTEEGSYLSYQWSP